MIQGNVVDLEARVGVLFLFPNRPDIAIEFVVDTGFAGALTLPAASIHALGLPFVQEMIANLADDNSVKVDVHAATIVVSGEELRVAVVAMGQRPLLGTALLAGKRLRAEFVENGGVVIENF